MAFVPQAIAQLSTGEHIVPESRAEQDYLVKVAGNDAYSVVQKDRLAKMGSLVNPQNFDINFNQNKRDSYPTDLDEPLRRMIRES